MLSPFHRMSPSCGLYAVEAIESRGLARPVGPDHRKQLVVVDVERHIVECGDTGKRQADVFEFDEVLVLLNGALEFGLEGGTSGGHDNHRFLRL